MSWHYSRALEEASSAGGFSDGVLFALSSGTSTPEPSSCLDRTMEASNRSPFGTTSGHSTGPSGEASSTSSPEVSRVRTSQSRGRAPASAENGPDSGGRWLASFARFDRDSSSWKTPQLSLVEDSTLSSETWPRSGTMRNGECWERPPLALLIDESESGFSRASIPTPTAGDSKSSGSRNTPSSRAHGGLSLTDYVRRDGGRGRMWPTPTVDAATERTAKYAQGGTSLSLAVRMLPTPTSSEHKYRLQGDSQQSKCLNALAGGALSPTWVEWLMGWPLGWTALDASGTDRYLKRRRRRSRPLQGGEDGHE